MMRYSILLAIGVPCVIAGCNKLAMDCHRDDGNCQFGSVCVPWNDVSHCASKDLSCQGTGLRWSPSAGSDLNGMCVGPWDMGAPLDMPLQPPDMLPQSPDMTPPPCKNGLWLPTPPLLLPGLATQLVGNSNFAEATPIALAVADFDGDGGTPTPDVVSANVERNRGNMLPDRASITVFRRDPTRPAAFGQPQAVVLGNGVLVRSIVADDFNGDGHQDVAATTTTDEIWVYRGNGSGTLPFAPLKRAAGGTTSEAMASGRCDLKATAAVFVGRLNDVVVLPTDGTGAPIAVKPIDSNLGGRPVAIATRFEDGKGGWHPLDLNNDGKLDIVVAIDPGPGMDASIHVLLGNGDCTFKSPIVHKVGHSPQALAVADIDGKGTLDLILANLFMSPVVKVFIGNGDGTFLAPVEGLPEVPAMSNTRATLTLIDLDGKNGLDVVTANDFDTMDANQYAWTYSNTASVFLNDGNGLFTTPTSSHFLGASPTAIANLGPWKQGAPAELAFATSGYSIAVTLGRGTGTLRAPAVYRPAEGGAPGVGYDLALEDVDGDGTIDVIVANDLGRAISIYSNDGAGALRLAALVRTDRDTVAVAADNLDGDQKPDVVAIHQGANDGRLSLFQNQSQPGMIKFGPEQGIAIGSKPDQVAIGRIGPNGANAIVACSHEEKLLWIVPVDAKGNLQPVKTLRGYHTFALADVTSDGTPEIVAAIAEQPDGGLSGYYVDVLGPDGERKSRADATVATGGFGRLIGAEMEVNTDGGVDVVAGEIARGRIWILHNAPKGLMPSVARMGLSGFNFGLMAAADLDRDGLNDVASGSGWFTYMWISTLRNLGKGDLEPPISYPTGAGPASVIAGDLNRDGRPDLVVTNRNSGSFTVHLSECAP